MNTRIALLSLASVACLSAARAPNPVPANPPANTPVTGDYVEARTASVFAGACHYNGERVTVGHEAILAWQFSAGTWHGTDLAGVRAVGSVTCDDNLAEAGAARRCELVVDGTPAQAAAVADLLAVRDGDRLGPVVSARTGPVAFEKDGRAYHVSAAGFAELSVQPMPNDACCSQPSLVWYAPLTPLSHRKVGYTHAAAYTAGTLGDPWQRSDENSAFFGRFSL